ncbi:MAG: SPOR domain-containing protein [Flavobacteriaceae bacterium]|nr:SPOR domain-containing protein [Flavobacteriaceae bacterium]MCY4216906.1 SPOR domain-containing protein [Flavobacteriaceae bacterium]MCY4253567.1 SPOR domain-containing protein [Flavobacteriaceae bacterium]
MEVHKAILELLETKNQLTVPYFGTFFIKENKARSNQRGTYYSKKRMIDSFDPTRHINDRELAEFLAEKKQISYALALKKIQGSVGYWKSQIKKGPYQIDGLGTFNRNQNRIDFQGLKTGVSVSENFGLPSQITVPSIQPSQNPQKKAKGSAKNTAIVANQNSKSKQNASVSKIESTKGFAQPKTASKDSSKPPSKSNIADKQKTANIVFDTKQPPQKKKIKSGDSFYPRRKSFPIKIALALSFIIGLIVGSVGVYYFFVDVEPSIEPSNITKTSQEIKSNELDSITKEITPPVQIIDTIITPTIPDIESEIFAIVIGSFNTQSEALQFIEDIKPQNVEARISNRTGQSRIRVITGYYDSVNQALEALDKIQQTITADAWILKED